MISATPPRISRQIDTSKSQVLTADPDIIKMDVETLPVEAMADLILQDIGAVEFILLTRNGRVAGKTVDRKRVSDVLVLASQYGPKTLGSVESNVRGTSYTLPLSKFVDEDETAVSVDGQDIVMVLKDVPVGMDVEVIVEVAPSITEWREV